MERASEGSAGLKVFGREMKRERKNKGLSLTELSHRSDVPCSVISAAEHGRRQLGREAAEKVSKILFPSPAEEEQRLSFVYRAVTTLPSVAAMDRSRNLPSALLDVIAQSLLRQKVLAKDIVVSRIETSSASGTQQDLVLELRDGRVMQFEFKVTEKK